MPFGISHPFRNPFQEEAYSEEPKRAGAVHHVSCRRQWRTGFGVGQSSGPH